MARIIPNDTKEFHNSYGEKLVYEAFKKLPHEYVIFYSLNWNRKQKKEILWGESDFTVFHPKKGIIVIEVKSGSIQLIEGQWEQLNIKNGNKIKIKDPMIQAERSKYTFLDLLRNDQRYKNYKIECAVWLTMVESYKQLGKLPPAYKIGNLLIKKDIEEIEKSILRIFDYYELKEQSIYSKEDEKFVIRTLSPEFNIVPNISNIIEEAEYNFNRMTFEQSKLIDYLDCQRVASIQGGAGTGKTLLAIEKIKKLLENEETKNDKVLFLCFNEFLYSYLDLKYKDELINATFLSIDKLVKKHYKIKNKYATEEEKLNFLYNYNNYDWDYKHIIIDEGQDFTKEEIDALYLIAELEGGCFYLFYDKNQIVNKGKTLFFDDRLECRLILTTNCRNTKNIAISSNKILNIEKYKLNENIKGEKPILYISDNVESIKRIIEEEITKYKNEKISLKRIVILTVKTEKKSILSNINEIGIYNICHDLEKKGILFTTARKYKGLESDVVIIIDIDKNTFEDEMERRVFHVAISRAKVYLSCIARLNEIDKLDVCEKLTGKRNSKYSLLIEEALNMRIIEGSD